MTIIVTDENSSFLLVIESSTYERFDEVSTVFDEVSSLLRCNMNK